jgi:hypothetical protein
MATGPPAGVGGGDIIVADGEGEANENRPLEIEGPVGRNAGPRVYPRRDLRPSLGRPPFPRIESGHEILSTALATGVAVRDNDPCSNVTRAQVATTVPRCVVT